MARYKILTGPYAGEIVEEGRTFIAGMPFSQLDEDMQVRVREYAEDRYKLFDTESDFPVSLDQLVDDYETSWQSVEWDDIEVDPEKILNSLNNYTGRDIWNDLILDIPDITPLPGVDVFIFGEYRFYYSQGSDKWVYADNEDDD